MYLDQTLNPFLDNVGLWMEARGELTSDLVNEVAMCHVFAIFHNSYNASLKATHDDTRLSSRNDRNRGRTSI
jgi:hypothetical protein